MNVEYAPQAEVDVAIAAEELTLRLGGSLARTFLARLDATAKKVATMPLAFALVEPPLPNHPGLRIVPVTRFAARLILYTPTDAGILVVRVLRAAGDWQSALG